MKYKHGEGVSLDTFNRVLKGGLAVAMQRTIRITSLEVLR